MPIETQVNLFSVAAAAEELLTNPENVQRLIARGKLSATRHRDDEPHCIAPADLTAYVNRGRPDFDTRLRSGASWFDDADTGNTDGFVNSMTAAIARQVPGEEALVARFKKAGNPDSLSLAVEFKGDVARIANAKVGGQWNTAGNAYLASRIRKSAKTIAGRHTRFGQTRLAALYASPKQYSEITALAVADAIQGCIAFSTHVSTPNRFGTNESRTVSFQLAHSALTTSENILRLAELAL